jgi:hypothetical protein
MHGYSNDFCCYVPSERLLKEGGYGGGWEIVYFAMPTTLQTGIEDKIIAEVHRQMSPQFGGKQTAESTDAATVIAKLVEGLAVGTSAEYDRIPEIWRVAVDAGKRNDTDELRKLLDLSVPKLNEPVAHWQVVVCGGGIINGLSMTGVWPRTRIVELVQADPLLRRRCERLVEQCLAMADDEAVRGGTRYDALRVLGADEYSRSGETLKRILKSGDAELQMGAISGLSDMESGAAAEAIVAAFSHYNASNQKLAVEALLRNNARRAMLRKAIESGHVPAAALTAEQVTKLRSP